ncbi:NAD(P)/FAD-dependent oxidoreductase [Actinokineospora auranticolor]|uniref:Pyridine nucleotide-disulfide oxidoreductase domain-containing protein 2 n=1 Tax=Actinokineospora auranticolor TaxID=155976 RepID=A0A2S6GV05_9PSEU|nr:NAD(P)/FAD-dependent oxidoreductase [Actinokineospora auranticolor]PPK69040.1 phytoene dehydrogenase-like protein [Actinokineospora auranticolor]
MGNRVVIVGGGHNALVAAAYLARAGRSVLVLERLGHVGGAAVSASPFPGVRLSRYSYLVSLLPDRIVHDLGLRLDLRTRSVSSYTPVDQGGLLVGGPDTAGSFRALTGSHAEYDRWREFYGAITLMAKALAPTLLEPVLTRESVRDLVLAAAGERTWRQVFEQSLGETLEETFTNDIVRGVVATDGLIGTYTSLYDLRANRCFLYHVIGNGTGDWRVPVGGMGSVTAELDRAARRSGARITTNAEVTAIEADGITAEVRYVVAGEERTVAADHVLSGVAPAILDRLRGRTPADAAPGAQLKINLLLDRLPRFKSGVSPEDAFAGTLHLDESFADLENAYRATEAGALPDHPPAETYCHTLTDRSIVDSPTAHTLTLFGLHTPAALFADPGARDELVSRYLARLNHHLVDPIEDCLAHFPDGRPCLEARTPLDLEADLSMPHGNIFHGDLTWPFAERPVGWGVETDTPNLLNCGSSALRGGGVSGIAGHNAAMALLNP